MIPWYRIKFDDETIELDVQPQNSESWQQRIKWSSIVRICFETGNLYEPDTIYIFVENREHSFAIPTEAIGGPDLWHEILKRGLFDPEEAIRLATTDNQFSCQPST